MPESDRGFLLLFEYGVGGEIDGNNLAFRPGRAHNSRDNDPGYTYSTDHLRLAKSLELGNGIRFWANDGDLDRVEKNLAKGYGAMVDIWLDYRKYAPGKGKSARAYCDEVVDRCREMAKKYDSKARFNIYPEVDNHA